MQRTLTILAVAALTSWPLMANTPKGCDPAREASVASSGNVDFKTKAAPFQVSINVQCDASGYPNGNLSINGLIVHGGGGVTMNATTFSRLVADSGVTPTAILSGACTLTGLKSGQSNDCQFWIRLTQITGVTQVGAGPEKLAVAAFKITKTEGGILTLDVGQSDPQSGSITVSAK